ncbi:MAG: hypothetical protein GY871_17180 [Actinomycetales bacterium]|nr:hypothetical protein [Actinomycetales bacterium]MCP4892327.1 hypothetical protein [Actinomycetales bacterium]
MVDDADCCTEHDVGLVLDDALAEGEGVAVVVDAGAEVAEGDGAEVAEGDGAGTEDAVLAGAGEGDGDAAASSATESDVIAVRPMAVLHSR